MMRNVSPQARMAAAAARRMQATPAPARPAMPGMKKGGSCHAKGGVTRADGCIKKGHTKGKVL